ncbi:type II secretory pathway pseudopilin PulG [Caulobacter ginsengisoli]|uniref:Type II secretory pathway pseudopilin PulG n=1 Tax=Caulobacter ginsengisoli TaxID=400775 RepID=A0ABU0IXK7_9CAUL|nr:hypothetical protein [Caulobacter ginsengisoli]MDQ0466735.1 type II secretory pathway pseudopilin PulG [Caulobacter ginsengisoli]
MPIYRYIAVDGYQMYPGPPSAPGIHHTFTPGLHLVAGVNGLGKSTFLLILYHGLVGPAAIRNDDFGVPQPEIVGRRDVDRFRRRVADGAKSAFAEVHFSIGENQFEVRRSLHDLSLVQWRLNGAEQTPDEQNYTQTLVSSMKVGGLADVILIMNLIVFMFENRGLLMWSPFAQRNALRALFMAPKEANELSQRAQAVATANSAYRNLLYIVNRDRKQLLKDEAALATAGTLSAEYHTLQSGVAAHNENILALAERRQALDAARTETRATHEAAKFNYDDVLREIEALKLARVAAAFPKSDESSRYVIARLIGDGECLACGAEDGPLIDRWVAAISEGRCLVCGADHSAQEAIVPPTAVDAARLAKAEARLEGAKQSMEVAADDAKREEEQRDLVQIELDGQLQKRSELEKRIRQIAGSLPPSPPAVAALKERVAQQSETLEGLREDQTAAELEFSKVFNQFKVSIEQKADEIREKFGSRISDFLVERAEITLAYIRAPIGESGQSYEWPTFQLSMTSGTFDAPMPRRTRSEVSMSQGEFIDLAFRLALVEVAAESGPASMVFDAPEASLDALFMRRAGAFLARFTRDNTENRLIVTSNLTNADMIPALFGAYEPQEGDPEPHVIPRDERKDRVIDLLTLAAPTSAVELVGDRYKNLLDRALFPPYGQGEPGH